MESTEPRFIAPEGQKQETRREADPFWWRQNTRNLAQVTSMESNPAIGVNEIILRPASANQLKWLILANGTLKTAVGRLSFQVRLSKNTPVQAPFVQTITDKVGTDEETGRDDYWEHIQLYAPVKAQILRYFEAWQSGATQMNPNYGMQQPFVQQPMNGYGQQPMNAYANPMYGGANPMYGGMPQQGMQPQYGGMPVQQNYGGYIQPQYGQVAQQSVAQNGYPDYGQIGQATQQTQQQAPNQVTGQQAVETIEIDASKLPI